MKRTLDKQEFVWMQAYVAAIRAGQSAGEAEIIANKCLDSYSKKFPPKETNE